MSELSPVLRRAGRVSLFLATAALIAGCQVRPLYSTSSTVPQKLAAIKISPADDRVEQVVRNRLIFLMTGGAGEAATADYQLQMNVTSAKGGILDDDISSVQSPARVTVTAQYSLISTKDSKVLKKGTQSTTALLDLGNQQFARLRAYRDAEDRAGRELAEFIRADLASVLGR